MSLYLALDSYVVGPCRPYSLTLSEPKPQSLVYVAQALARNSKTIFGSGTQRAQRRAQPADRCGLSPVGIGRWGHKPGLINKVKYDQN